VPEQLAAAVAAADAQLFAPLRAKLGLDEVVTVNVGAAPTPRDVLVFFHAIGIEVAELWGMSETCGAGCCNRPGQVRIGSVGPPAPGVEVKLAEDGELLVRSDVVMTGYRNAPEKTAEALDADGTLHSGDIGQIDDEGYLRIVDRKKELIITAGGKNISPANLEAALKMIPLVAQACAIGDDKPFVSALVVLDAEVAPVWAREQGIEFDSLADLATDERVVAEIERGLVEVMADFNNAERVKKVRVLSDEWLPDSEELTPTSKLKRRGIHQKYAEEIAQLYGG
jgi:long-chain acyl-CoA synthetase